MELKDHYDVQKSTSLEFIMSQLNTIHTLTRYLTD